MIAMHSARVGLVVLGLLSVDRVIGQQVVGCHTTGANSCFDNYQYLARDGSSCHDWLETRSCAKARGDYGFNDNQVAELYENCPSACKQCSFNNCNDDSTFSDYFSYSCSDWGSWDCSTAHTKYDYSDIQTQLLLKNCPKTCHVCGDLSDPACVYPFVYEGGKHHSSVARNGHRECLTRHGLWKVAIPSGTPCVRAYIFEGVSYTGCTTAGTHGDYAWCPTKVDPETLEPVDGHWSVCQDCNLASTLPIEDCHVTTSPTHSPTSTAPSKSPSPPPTPRPTPRPTRSQTAQPTFNPTVHENENTDGMGENNNANNWNNNNWNNNNWNQDGRGDNNDQDGMGDNNDQDGMGDNNDQDGMGDNNDQDGMGDNQDGDGMDRRARRGIPFFETTRPRYVSCLAMEHYKLMLSSTHRSRIHVLDQNAGEVDEMSGWERFVANKPAFGTFVTALVLLTVGGTFLGVQRYRRHKSYPAGWMKLKTRLNKYGGMANDDPFDGNDHT